MIGRPSSSTGDDTPLTSVELRSVPLALAARSRQHQETLIRELALVAAANDPSTAHGKLLALAAEVGAKYGRLGAAQREHAEAVFAAGGRTADLRYEVPVEFADDANRLLSLLEEVDRLCVAGELVSVVTPPDVAAYRRWLLGQFVTQINGSGPPVPFVAPEEVDTVTEVPARRAVTIAVEDDLDLEGAARARQAIADQLELGATEFVIDLAGCEFIDSTGVSLLLTTLIRLRRDGGSLVIVNPSASVSRALGHSGVLDMLAGRA